MRSNAECGPPESGICDFCGNEGEIVDFTHSRTSAGLAICAKCKAPKAQAISSKCPRCMGDGMWLHMNRPCPRCKGSGMVKSLIITELSDRDWPAQPANLREGCVIHVNGVGDL